MKWLEELTKVCEESGTTTKEGVLGWFMHHSILQEEDAVILGASDEKQVDETLKACEMSPPPEPVVKAFDNLWELNRNTPWKYAR